MKSHIEYNLNIRDEFSLPKIMYMYTLFKPLVKRKIVRICLRLLHLFFKLLIMIAVYCYKIQNILAQCLWMLMNVLPGFVELATQNCMGVRCFLYCGTLSYLVRTRAWYFIWIEKHGFNIENVFSLLLLNMGVMEWGWSLFTKKKISKCCLTKLFGFPFILWKFRLNMTEHFLMFSLNHCKQCSNK